MLTQQSNKLESNAYDLPPAPAGCQFNVVQDRLGYWHVRSALSISTHYTKNGAVDYARERASNTFSARVAIHNEDGSIDFVEHGFGQPDVLFPEFLSSSSGTTFPKVEASIDDMLQRGATALIKKKHGDSGTHAPVGAKPTSGRFEAATARKLLIVDYNADVREMFGTFLPIVGYTVSLAATLEEGLALARETSPDAVLLDWRSPGIGGFLAELRHLGAPSCIMLGGDVKSVMDAESHGVQYFLPKPVDLELVEHVLRTCFSCRSGKNPKQS